MLAAAMPGKAFGNVKSFLRAGAIAVGIRRRVQADAAAMKQQVADAKSKLPAEARTAMLARLDDLARQGQSVEPVTDGDFKAILPVGLIDRQVFALQADLWKASGSPVLAVSTCGPYEPIVPIHAGRRVQARLARVDDRTTSIARPP